MDVNRYDRAEVLATIWRLGAGEERLPTSHGILDRALRDTLSELPQELQGLSFGVTAVGLRCYELPDILLAAQEALLTTEPNPTYLSSLITLSEDTAREIALSHGISTSDARAAGLRLLNRVNQIRRNEPAASEANAAA